MKEKLAKLIDVKSIVTITLTVVFCVLALKQSISGTEFLTIFTLIISFYFNKQKETETTKKSEVKEGEEK